MLRSPPPAAPPQPVRRPVVARRAGLHGASQVLDWLYVGSRFAVTSRAALEQLGVSFVLSCCERSQLLDDRGLRTLALELQDVPGEQLAPHLGKAFEFLDEARSSGAWCLVHCVAGVSRSPAVVLAYLVAREGLSLAQAWDIVQTRRQVAQPSRSFVKQLIEFERELRGMATAMPEDFGFD